MNYATSYQHCANGGNDDFHAREVRSYIIADRTPEVAKTIVAEWTANNDELCEFVRDAVYSIPDAELAAAWRDKDHAELGRLIHAATLRGMDEKSVDAAVERLQVSLA
jgi:hypothetical protein